MTDAERLLWRHLRRDQLEGFSFRRQHPMGDYILDFYCPQVKLAVELDGSQHGQPVHASRDRERDAWLASRGIAVLRVWNGEIMSNLEGVWESIRLEVLKLAATAGMTVAATGDRQSGPSLFDGSQSKQAHRLTSPSKGEVGAKRREGVGNAANRSAPAGSTPTPALPLSGGGGKTAQEVDR